MNALTPKGTAAQKKLLRETCEANANWTAEEIIEQGVKLPPSVKDAFPMIYHYADANTLLNHAVVQPDGRWLLDVNDGGRYIGNKNFDIMQNVRSEFQLPRARELSSALTKGRFKCVIRTEDVADDLFIPRAWRHAAEEGVWSEKQWIEAIVVENPERGIGGVAQFIQKKAVSVEVVDLETGNVIRTLEELELALGGLYFMYFLVSNKFSGPHDSPRGVDENWYLILKFLSDYNYEIIVRSGKSPSDDSFQRTPKEMLSWKLRKLDADGKISTDSDSWFQKCCISSNCTWFVPIVQRMADGEDVSIEEIEAAYRENNGGKAMPKGTWGQMFRDEEV